MRIGSTLTLFTTYLVNIGKIGWKLDMIEKIRS